jgi:opacity protein-like surface antigen
MKGKAFFLTFAILAGMPLSGYADDNTGIYLGAGAGIGRIEANTRELGLLPADTGEQISGNDNFNNSSISSKFFIGYRPFRFFAVEVGYFKMHEMSQRECFLDPPSATGEPQACAESRDPAGTGASTLSSNTWTIELPTDAFTGYLVGLYPINETFDIFAKVGAVAWETEATAYERIAGGGADIANGGNCVTDSTGILVPKPPSVPLTNCSISKKFDNTDMSLALGMNFNAEGGLAVRTEFEWFDMQDFDKSWLASMSVMYTF